MIRTLKEIVLIVIVSVTVAVIANSVRANPSIKGHLSWSRNYFKRSPSPINALAETESNELDVEQTNAHSMPTPQNAPPKDDLDDQEFHFEHDFQTISHEDVVALLDDPNTQANLNIFVDARNDEAFEKGHIPGAIQADHYELEFYVDNLLQYALSADKIAVYCNGGNCEDSVLMCQDLLELGIDRSVIFLYEGGWKAWEASGAPIETGP